MELTYKLQSTENKEDYEVIVIEDFNSNSINKGNLVEVVSIVVDEKKVKVYADVTWGEYGYFNIGSRWFKTLTENWESMCHHEDFRLKYC